MLPGELLVDMDKSSRSLLVMPELAAAIPELSSAFQQADQIYEKDPLAYLERMADSVFYVNQEGRDIPCSLIYNSETSKSDQILVMFAPFSDGSPQTEAEVLYAYLQKTKVNLADKERAKPNAYNQTTKAAVAHDVLWALGNGMPVLTIYSPVPPQAYTSDEREAIGKGDLSPVGRTAINAIAHTQQILHGTHSETQIREVNTHGASLGDNAIAAAGMMAQGDKFQVKSVTAQELILGPKNLLDLFDRYSIRMMIGDPSERCDYGLAARIPEPAVRRDIDRHGSEPTTYLRLIQAMAKLSYLKALTKPGWLSNQILSLVENGVPVTVANARNSHVSHETVKFLPVGHPNFGFIDIQAVAGQKVGHLADEHIGLVTTALALGIRRAVLSN